MNHVKVLLISNGFQPNYEKAFANGLAANGVQVILVSSDRTLTGELDASVSVINLRGSQDPTRPSWKKAANLLRYICVLLQHIRRERYPVVHLTGLYLTRNVLAGYLEWIGYRLLVSRFFMTVHNVLPHGRHGMWYHLLHRGIYRLPHVLVVHTVKMKTDLVQKFGVSEARIVVMAHGVDAVPDTLTVPNPSKVLRVLLFGQLHPYKGVDLFLLSLRHCGDIPIDVVIAGNCRDSKYAREVDKLLANTQPNHTLRWIRGFIPEEEVARYFESSDVVVLPYRHIDQSGVLFTAFRFGVPVITTDVGSFRENVPPFAGLIVDRPEQLAIAAAVREFYGRRDKFDRHRIRTHAKASAWSLSVAPLIEAYRNRLAEAKAP